jgi:predicted DNA-binding protein (UPF0251 family)
MPVIPSSFRRIAVASVAVIVLGGAAVGIAAAQAQPATPTSGYQKFIDALAQRLGISSQQLQTDITQARQDAGLPANGGFGYGRGGPRGGFGLDFNAAATAIGITPQQLKQELPGKSLAQVAQNHGKTAQDVINALTTSADQRIDQAVSSGRITSDQGNTRKTNVSQRINQLVNQVMPQGGPGFRRGPGGPGGFGASVRGQFLQTAADAIGISVQQLQQELPGKSLAQVAQAHGKTGTDVANALKNAAHQGADQRVDQLVNQVMPQRPGPGGQDTSSTGA